MPRRKVFIGWNGENQVLAQKISAQLYRAEFEPIVGGEDTDATMFVGTTIIDQMNRAEMAILLFEPLPAERGGGVSTNVMFEWGYLLHKLPDARHIRIYLLNMDASLLPSDVAGCWSCRLEKAAAESPEMKDKMFNDLATEISTSFIEYASNGHFISNKLDYFDNWDNNKQAIFQYDGATRISYKLLFGMQICIYSGHSDILYQKLDEILHHGVSNKELMQVLNCAKAILDVFIKSKNLSQALTEEQFAEVVTPLQTQIEFLDIPEENNIHDPNLAAWCRIFLLDKMELCYELVGRNEDYFDRDAAWSLAAAHCLMVLIHISQQVEQNPDDAEYALLYRSFAHRNMFLVCQELQKQKDSQEFQETLQSLLQLEEQLQGMEAVQNLHTLQDIMVYHCKESMQYRRRLYQHYISYRPQSSVTMDYVIQEYLLGMVEWFQYEKNLLAKQQLRTTIRSIQRKVREANEIRSMIYKRIHEAISKVPELNK